MKTPFICQLFVNDHESSSVTGHTASWSRARSNFRQMHAQFHCGSPSPAALPRIWMRINPEFSKSDWLRSIKARLRSRCTRRKSEGFPHRLYPAFLGSSHKSRALIEHTGVVSAYEIFVLILLFYGNCGTKFQNAGLECDRTGCFLFCSPRQRQSDMNERNYARERD